jgi:hypothetical protein
MNPRPEGGRPTRAATLTRRSRRLPPLHPLSRNGSRQSPPDRRNKQSAARNRTTSVRSVRCPAPER